jgi:saccharopine dehydrogenase-like NADP-dependent oxidoreductase
MLPPSRAAFAPLTMSPNGEGSQLVSNLVRGADLVISLLPATMHLQVAEAAIAHKKHMITASYVSEALRGIHQDAVNAGISIINEVGLDPGIDHMMIMKSIDDIHERGGKVTELVSLCGGLPDPVAGIPPVRCIMCVC